MERELIKTENSKEKNIILELNSIVEAFCQNLELSVNFPLPKCDIDEYIEDFIDDNYLFFLDSYAKRCTMSSSIDHIDIKNLLRKDMKIFLEKKGYQNLQYSLKMMIGEKLNQTRLNQKFIIENALKIIQNPNESIEDIFSEYIIFFIPTEGYNGMPNDQKEKVINQNCDNLSIFFLRCIENECVKLGYYDEFMNDMNDFIFCIHKLLRKSFSKYFKDIYTNLKSRVKKEYTEFLKFHFNAIKSSLNESYSKFFVYYISGKDCLSSLKNSFKEQIKNKVGYNLSDIFLVTTFNQIENEWTQFFYPIFMRMSILSDECEGNFRNFFGNLRRSSNINEGENKLFSKNKLTESMTEILFRLLDNFTVFEIKSEEIFLNYLDFLSELKSRFFSNFNLSYTTLKDARINERVGKKKFQESVKLWSTNANEEINLYVIYSLHQSFPQPRYRKIILRIMRYLKNLDFDFFNFLAIGALERLRPRKLEIPTEIDGLKVSKANNVESNSIIFYFPTSIEGKHELQFILADKEISRSHEIYIIDYNNEIPLDTMEESIHGSLIPAIASWPSVSRIGKETLYEGMAQFLSEFLQGNPKISLNIVGNGFGSFVVQQVVKEIPDRLIYEIMLLNCPNFVEIEGTKCIGNLTIVSPSTPSSPYSLFKSRENMQKPKSNVKFIKEDNQLENIQSIFRSANFYYDVEYLR